MDTISSMTTMTETRLKLEVGRCDYQIGNHGQIYSVLLCDKDSEPAGAARFYKLWPISPWEWEKVRGDKNKDVLRGIPTMFTLADPSVGILLYPAPDRDYVLLIHQREER